MSLELLIDIGHSHIKWGFARDGVLDTAGVGRTDTDDPGALYSAAKGVDARRVLLSGQSRPDVVARIAERLGQGSVEVDIIATGDRPLPVAPAYRSLGCDRWLALQPARQKTSGPLVVVDCGTAITVDVVDADGRHLGGWIMAGVEAARSGLFARAPGLNRPIPDVEVIDRPARDTGRALARGSLLLATAGIDRAVAAAERAVDDRVSLWLTGGNAARLSPYLARNARHEQHLVLHGLAMATQAK